MGPAWCRALNASSHLWEMEKRKWMSCDHFSQVVVSPLVSPSIPTLHREQKLGVSISNTSNWATVIWRLIRFTRYYQLVWRSLAVSDSSSQQKDTAPAPNIHTLSSTTVVFEQVKNVNNWSSGFYKCLYWSSTEALPLQSVRYLVVSSTHLPYHAISNYLFTTTAMYFIKIRTFIFLLSSVVLWFVERSFVSIWLYAM